LLDFVKYATGFELSPEELMSELEGDFPVPWRRES
jgi:hypothetical protein